MKQKFSTKWKKSKQPRKQRKYRANAPLHIRKKFVSASLNKELRKKHGKKSIPIRKGDTIKIMRGKFKGKQGKVTIVKLKKSKVAVEGIQVKKLEGSKVNVMMQPSNLQIIELYLEDKKRIKKLGIKEIKKEEEVKKQKKKDTHKLKAKKGKK